MNEKEERDRGERETVRWSEVREERRQRKAIADEEGRGRRRQKV